MKDANTVYNKIIDQHQGSAQALVNSLIENRLPRPWYTQETWIPALVKRLPALACPQGEGQITHFFQTFQRLIGENKYRDTLSHLAEAALLERNTQWVQALAYRQARALWRGAIRNHDAMEILTQTPDLIAQKTVERLVDLSVRRIKQVHTPQAQTTAATLLIVKLAATRPDLLDDMKAQDMKHFRVALGRCGNHEELALFKREFLMRYNVQSQVQRSDRRMSL